VVHSQSKGSGICLDWDQRNPWLGQRLQDRFCPDETWFQTVICNATQFHRSGDNFRFIDWSTGAGHPKLLEHKDLPSILGSKAHFRR
jgi:hypothetical protein